MIMPHIVQCNYNAAWPSIGLDMFFLTPPTTHTPKSHNIANRTLTCCHKKAHCGAGVTEPNCKSSVSPPAVAQGIGAVKTPN